MSVGKIYQFVDYSTNTAGDTGANSVASIEPLANGEDAVSTVFNRPLESLRQRFETLRGQEDDTLYLRDADRMLLLAGPGHITWPGSTTAAQSGILVITDTLYLLPFLTPGAAQTAPIPPVASHYGTLTLLEVGSTPGIIVTSKRRSYESGDKISVQVVSGGALSAVVSGDPSHPRSILLTVTGATTLTAAIAALNAITADSPATQLVTAVLAPGALGTDLVLAPQTRQFVVGNFDGEGHAIAPAALVTFFSSVNEVDIPGGDFITQGVLPGDTLSISGDTGGGAVNGLYTIAEVLGPTALLITTMFPSAKTINVAAVFTVTGPGGSPIKRATSTATSAAKTTIGNALAEGDTLCVAYDSLIASVGTGGRRQSIPENSNTSIPAGSFFNSRVNAERLANALPICKVVNGRLIFLSGVEIPAGSVNVDLGGTDLTISYLGGPPWADGTTNPATTVEGQLDKIVSDLAGAGGAAKWGIGGTFARGKLPNTLTRGQSGSAVTGAFDAVDLALAQVETASVTVADGTTSFGDFNVSTYGTANATFAAALAALPVTGGIVFIKHTATNIYDVTTSLDPSAYGIQGRVLFVGEHEDVTLRANGATPVFLMNDNGISLGLMNLKVLRNGPSSTAQRAIQMQDTGVKVWAKNCTIDGLQGALPNPLGSGSFENVAFIATVGGDGDALNATLSQTVFNNCTFRTDVNSAGATCATIGNGTSSVTFDNCDFTHANALPTRAVFLENQPFNVTFRGCRFHAGGSPTGIAVEILSGGSGSPTGILFERCRSDFMPGFLKANESTGLRVIDCEITQGSTSANNVKMIALGTASAGCLDTAIRGCSFLQTGLPASAANPVHAISAYNTTDLLVSGCKIVGFDVGINLGTSGPRTCTRTKIVDCLIDGHGATFNGRFGVYLSTGLTLSDLSMKNCTITNLNDQTFGSIAGVGGHSGVTNLSQLSIENCTFKSINAQSGFSVSASAVYIDGASSLLCRDISFINNTVTSVFSTNIFAGGFAFLHMPDHCVIADNRLDRIQAVDGTNAVSSAILLLSCQNVTIANNTITRIGTQVSGVSDTCRGIDVKSSGTMHNVCITGNTFSTFGGTDGSHIRTRDFLRNATIAGNTIDGDVGTFPNVHGILHETSGFFSGLEILEECTITNNVVNATRYGIYLVTGANADTVNVSNNVVTDFLVHGISTIMQSASSGDRFENLIIAGNIIKSSRAGFGHIAVLCDSAGAYYQYVVIANNSIQLSNTSNNVRPVDTTNMNRLTFTGNNIVYDHADANGAVLFSGITLNAPGLLTVTGNFIEKQSGAAGTAVFYINNGLQSNQMSIRGNVFRGFTALIGGTFSAQIDTALNTGMPNASLGGGSLAPASLGNICENTYL